MGRTWQYIFVLLLVEDMPTYIQYIRVDDDDIVEDMPTYIHASR